MKEAMKQWADDVSKAYDILAFGNTERASEILGKTRDAIRKALAEQALQALHDENVRLGLYAYEASMQSNDRMTVDPITGNVSIGTVEQQKQDESDELTIAYMSGLYDGKKLAKQEQGEPVAWMFQHEETGRITFVEAQQLEWGFEKGNPRLKKIGPLYTEPHRAWIDLTDQDFIDLSASGLALWGLWKAIARKLKELNT